ncbi:hypothetical protein BGX38DRAFT_1162584 [Terfezia claveryi]|nr:hypothetical protein BGX38DRAFT_1162584 [Terfezia claveryi]
MSESCMVRAQLSYATKIPCVRIMTKHHQWGFEAKGHVVSIRTCGEDFNRSSNGKLIVIAAK